MERNQFLEAKVILLGASGVGKSSIAVRFCRGTFTHGLDATIGVTHLQQVVLLKGHSVKFLFYDTAGQERFESIAASYYRAADAVILVYDLSRKDSLSGARKWHQEMKQQTSKQVVLALVGNKADLVSMDQRQSDEAAEFAQEIGALHMFVSASSDENITALFTWVAEKLNPSLLLEPDPAAMASRTLSIQKKTLVSEDQSECLNC